MSIFLHILYLVLVFSLMGWGVKKLIGTTNSPIFGESLILGCSISISLYYPLFFIFEKSSESSTYSTLLFFILLSIIYWIVQYKKTPLNIQFFANKDHIYALLIFIFVVIFSAIPYVQGGGVDAYWHTANEDMFDGLDGQNAYLVENDRFKPGAGKWGFLQSGEIREVYFNDSKSKAHLLNPEPLGNKNEYYTHSGFLQYSSLAFIQDFIFVDRGFDTLLIFMLVNLGIFGIGAYYCSRHVFKQSVKISVQASLMSTLGNFYLTTWFNGHMGSIMYNAAIPYLLYYSVSFIRNEIYKKEFLLKTSILIVYILGAYPFPLMFMLAPLAIYGLYTKFYSKLNYFIPKSILQRILIVICIGVILFIIAYFLLEPVRERAMASFRSWGTVLNYVGYLQFWGIWQSGLAFSPPPDELLNVKTSLDSLNQSLPIIYSSITFSILLACIFLYGALIASRKNIFALIWIGFLLFFFIIMRFASTDSYYLYKFLYLNSWIVYLFTFIGFGKLLTSNKAYVKLLTYIVATVWIFLNISNNLFARDAILNNKHNNDINFFQILDNLLDSGASTIHNKHNNINFYQILDIPNDILSKSYLWLPHSNELEVAKRILFDNGMINTKRSINDAEFIIASRIADKNFSDDIWGMPVSDVVTETEDFKVYKIRDHDVFEFFSHWDPEGSNPLFRWVSDDLPRAMYLNLNKPSKQIKYIHLCGQAFQNLDDQFVDLSVYDSNSKYIGSVSIEKNYGCHTIPITITKNPFPYKVTHKINNARKASVVDSRRLVYRIMYIDVSSSKYPPEKAYNFHLFKDIFSLNNFDIRLGSNWYGFENFSSETFRWAKDNAEIIVRPIKYNTQLNMLVEKGPSAGDIDLTISLIDKEKNIIDSCHVVKRTDCLFKLPLTSLTSKWTITSNAENNPVSYDHRLLNYRIFSMELK